MMTTRAGASFVLGAFVLAGCLPADMPVASAPPETTVAAAPAPKAEPAAAPAVVAEKPSVDPELAAMYASRADGDRMLPAIDVSAFHRELLRNKVEYPSDQPPGSIVIDTHGPFLYFIEPGGMATRYGIAVGREGFGWSGTGTIERTARWPRWTPPPEMIKRDPSLEKWRDGQPGGVSNPLGARALYIYFGDRDSGYRIHGTNTPKSIGWAASSGCFRMLNQDVIDLYDRVHKGARVVVL
jgi:lipoprotein-anchoring transpeptidase ErfK/SrfK